MRHNVFSSALIAFSCVLISACSKTEEKSASSAEAAKNLRVSGGIFVPIRPCNGVAKPKQSYKLTIDQNFNFFNTNTAFIIGSDDNNYGEKKGDPAKRPSTENSDAPTPLDFAVYLKEGESALIEIEVADDTNITLMPKYHGTEAAVTAASGLGIEYLCGLDVTSDRKASFTVYRPAGAGTAGYIGYNIGLVVKQGAYVLPLHVDPNIKNDG